MKIPPELDNPIDNRCVELGEYLSEYFRKINMTANDLTSVSFIAGLLSLYMFVKGNYAMCALFYIIGHSFDCFDGYYARKYNMVTDFGDYYDHITDVVIDTTLLFLIVRKYMKLKNNNPKKYVPLLLIPLSLLMFIQFGCQEIYIDSKDAGHVSLSVLKPLCPKDDGFGAANVLKYTRFFGRGTFVLAVCSIILLSGPVDRDIQENK